MTASIFFKLDEHNNIIRKPRSEYLHRNITTALFQSIDQELIFLELFFARVAWLDPPLPTPDPDPVDYSPFVWALGLTAKDTEPLPTNKDDLPFNWDSKIRRLQYYERYYAQEPKPTDTIRSIYWRDFWSNSIHHTARNVWYRLIHNKIPNGSLMYSWMPEIFPNPYCHLCMRTSHPPLIPLLMSNNHWFFDFPLKRPIWESIWTKVFTNSPVPIQELKNYIYNLDPMKESISREPLLQNVSLSQIVALTLRGIWISYWTWIFRKKHQSPSDIITNVYHSIIRLWCNHS